MAGTGRPPGITGTTGTTNTKRSPPGISLPAHGQQRPNGLLAQKERLRGNVQQLGKNQKTILQLLNTLPKEFGSGVSLPGCPPVGKINDFFVDHSEKTDWIHVNQGNLFGKVAHAVVNEKVVVVAVNDKEVNGRYTLHARDLAHFWVKSRFCRNMDALYFNSTLTSLGCLGLKRAPSLNDYASEKATVFHELVHALIDLSKLSIVKICNEMAAYCAAGLYQCCIDPTYKTIIVLQNLKDLKEIKDHCGVAAQCGLLLNKLKSLKATDGPLKMRVNKLVHDRLVVLAQLLGGIYASPSNFEDDKKKGSAIEQAMSYAKIINLNE